MTKKEFADELMRLYKEGMTALKNGDIRKKCECFELHDKMCADPSAYVDK